MVHMIKEQKDNEHRKNVTYGNSNRQCSLLPGV